MEACTACSLCVDVCPAVAASRDGFLSGYYRISELKKINRSRSAFLGALCKIFGRTASPERLREYGDTVFRCTLCGRCQEVCPSGIPLRDLWFNLRTDMVRSGAGPQKVFMIRDNLRESHNVFAEDNGERAGWVDNLRERPDHGFVRERADVVYFTGCVSSYFPMAQKIPMALAETFERTGVDFTLLGEDEWCCGFPLLGAGLFDHAGDIIAHNVDAVKRRGARTVVFACPSCYQMWREHYPDQFEIVHVTEFLTRLLREDRLPFAELPMKVTYHDPCDLGRGAHVFEEPREIIRSIPGLELVELPLNRENCQCCGGGGNMEMIDPELSSKIAGSKMVEVASTGADAVVTSCQQCVRTMNTFARRNKVSIEVLDIAELVQRALRR